MLSKVNKLLDESMNFMAVLGRLVIILMTFLIIADLIALNFFNYSIAWILEVSEYLIVFLTFLGVAWLLKEDGHIKLDLLLNRLSQRNRLIAEIVNSCIGLCISLIITIYGFRTAWGLYERGIKTETILEIPRSLLIVIIPIGFTFVILQCVRNLISSMSKLKNL